MAKIVAQPILNCQARALKQIELTLGILTIFDGETDTSVSAFSSMNSKW